MPGGCADKFARCDHACGSIGEALGQDLGVIVVLLQEMWIRSSVAGFACLDRWFDIEEEKCQHETTRRERADPMAEARPLLAGGVVKNP